MNVGGSPSSSFNIFTMTAAGGSKTARTTETGVNLHSQNPHFSTDGTRIVFESKKDVDATTAQSYNIWIINSDGSSATALTENTDAGLDSALGRVKAWY
jgi:Tol biopolymer transport system component